MESAVDSSDKAPGFYVDGDVRRYWDGRKWTDQTRPLPRSSNPQAPTSRWLVVAVVPLLVLLVAGGILWDRSNKQDAIRSYSTAITVESFPDTPEDCQEQLAPWTTFALKAQAEAMTQEISRVFADALASHFAAFQSALADCAAGRNVDRVDIEEQAARLQGLLDS